MKRIKKYFCIVFVLALNGSGVFAEPISVEQADFFVQPGKTFEIGTGVGYSYAKYYYGSSPAAVYENKDTTIPFFLRFKPVENIEISLKSTYRLLEETEFAINKKNIGYIDVSGKMSLFSGLAANLQVGIPGGNPDNSAVEGINIGARLLTTVKLNPLLVHVNGGYAYTMEYTLGNMKVNPGNYIFGGASFEYELSGINPLLEFTVMSVENSTAGGVVNTDNSLLLDLLAGFSWQAESLKIKAGLDYSLDVYNLYNWKIISSLSLLL